MGRAAKLAIFERGSAALGALFPHAAGLYACPLCLLGFSIDEIEEDGWLSEEHAPPDKLHGDVVCLTCKRCNNRAGELLDSHMIRAERLLDFAAGRDTPPMRARMKVHDVMQRGRVSMENGGLKFYGVTQANPTGTAADVQTVFDGLVALGEDASGTNLQLFFDDTFDERRVAIGWLRSAYLVAFAAFGYRYIWRPCFDAIRQQIYDPAAEIFDAPMASDVAATGRRMLFVVNEPDELVGVHVFLGIRSIVLPDIEGDDGYIERAAAMRLRREKTSTVRGSHVEWPTITRHLLDRP